MGSGVSSVVTGIVAAGVALGSVGGWTEEPTGRGSEHCALADVDVSNATTAPPRAAAVRRPDRTVESSRVPVFLEDFQGGVMPDGWMVIDNDGLTVAPAVSYFTDAWMVRQDFDNTSDLVAMSTSWYQPAGQSDDWLITPDIAIGPNMELAWRAEAQDPIYPDGYNVRVSTTGQSIAGCQANPTLFSIAHETGGVWTDRSASLAAYAGSTVNICFQNNSIDEFILMVDDIAVNQLLDHDAAVTAAEQASEYGQAPAPLGFAMALGATVENTGLMDVTGVVLNAAVMRDGATVHTEASTPIATLAPGASQAVDLPDYVPATVGVYTVEYTVTIAESDEDPSNDTALAPFDLVVGADRLGRDDGVRTGNLGIGAGVLGELGVQFSLPVPALLRGAEFLVGPFTPPVDPGDPDIVGDTTYVTLREMVGGVPGAVVATSEIHTFADYDEHLLVLPFTPPVALPAGDFVLTVAETGDTLALGTAVNIFTPGTNWINWPGNPFGGWANNEDFGAQFAVTYVLRAVLGLPTLTVVTFGDGTVTSVPVGIDCGATCSAQFPVDQLVDLIPNPGLGAVFTGWGGDADCADGAVTMSADVSCTATFGPDTRTLSVATYGAGSGTITSTPEGIDCGADCSEIYAFGTVVDLTVTPDAGSYFSRWLGPADCADGQVTLTDSLTCTAQIELFPPLFVDGFESGTTSAWSTTVP